MNYLMDTHTFVWWSENARRLSDRVAALCEDTTQGLYLSLASLWEMQIKIQLGKLTLVRPLRQLIQAQIALNGLRVLPIYAEHIFALEQLPNHHRDPFDRLLVAQALHENLPILSNDALIVQYPITVIW